MREATPFGIRADEIQTLWKVFSCYLQCRFTLLAASVRVDVRENWLKARFGMTNFAFERHEVEHPKIRREDLAGLARHATHFASNRSEVFDLQEAHGCRAFVEQLGTTFTNGVFFGTFILVAQLLLCAKKKSCMMTWQSIMPLWTRPLLEFSSRDFLLVYFEPDGSVVQLKRKFAAHSPTLANSPRRHWYSCG